jgi:hypothetical protein
MAILVLIAQRIYEAATYLAVGVLVAMVLNYTNANTENVIFHPAQAEKAQQATADTYRWRYRTSCYDERLGWRREPMPRFWEKDVEPGAPQAQEAIDKAFRRSVSRLKGAVRLYTYTNEQGQPCEWFFFRRYT